MIKTHNTNGNIIRKPSFMQKYAIKYCNDKILDLLFKNRDITTYFAIKQSWNDDFNFLEYNEDFRLRYGKASLGRCKDLDILINDESCAIRNIIVSYEIDKYLGVLINDEDYSVRCTVAEQARNKDLDILVKDEISNIRSEVAHHGKSKDLDVLINDEYYDVLFEVIKHDRDNDLKILKNHKYKCIRNAVQEILKSKFQL